MCSPGLFSYTQNTYILIIYKHVGLLYPIIMFNALEVLAVLVFSQDDNFSYILVQKGGRRLELIVHAYLSCFMCQYV